MSFWTPAKSDRAEALYRSGQSCSRIAKALGATRNAVIGKLHRMGVSVGMKGRANVGNGRSAVTRAKAAPKRSFVPLPEGGDRLEAHRREMAGSGVALVAALENELADAAIRLMDRRRFQCAWPVGKPPRPAEQLCCGAMVQPGRPTSTESYCPHHAAHAVSSTVKPKSADALERIHQSQMARAA